MRYFWNGAFPRFESVRKGTFDLDLLFRQLEGRLHPNLPREEWPDPGAAAGMVTSNRSDGSSQSFLLFNQAEFAEALFKKARQNVVR